MGRRNEPLYKLHAKRGILQARIFLIEEAINQEEEKAIKYNQIHDCFQNEDKACFEYFMSIIDRGEYDQKQ